MGLFGFLTLVVVAWWSGSVGLAIALGLFFFFVSSAPNKRGGVSVFTLLPGMTAQPTGWVTPSTESATPPL